jgi:hypothetical protein
MSIKAQPLLAARVDLLEAIAYDSPNCPNLRLRLAMSELMAAGQPL